LPAGDDLMFIHGFLDNMFDCTKNIDMDRHIIIPHLTKNRKNWKRKILCNYHGSNINWPVVGMSFLMKREC